MHLQRNCYVNLTGNGGIGGRQTIYIRDIEATIHLNSCRGYGGTAALNGRGGPGKQG